MPKEIQWPTDEWLDAWLAKHPGKTSTDADCAWWDAQIDKGNPTPYDLTEEQEKEVKVIRGNARAANAYGKKVKRERKPNFIKREIINHLNYAITNWDVLGDCVLGDDFAQTVQTVNPERQIDFMIGGKHYTLTLTEHREKKG